MARPRPLLQLALPAFLVAAVLAAGCAGNDTVSPNPDLDFLVGDWTAVHFIITPVLAPESNFDLIEEGGTFTLNVQPSGQYTAILSLPGLGANPEIGTISVEGDELVFLRTVPGPTVESRATFHAVTQDRLAFNGPSQIDVDGNGSDDAITVDVEIIRQ